MSKNGTILIAFAWAMEIVGVAGGVSILCTRLTAQICREVSWNFSQLCR